LTPVTHLDAWRGATTGTFRARVFLGDHFYLVPRRAEVLADVAATLSGLIRIDHVGT
jgi:pyochelin biosynthetic protein PchC